jgi:hypothetical protein
LAGAEHSHHPYVPGGRVAAGVGIDTIQGPVAAVTGQLTHAGMRANRVEAGMIA